MIDRLRRAFEGYRWLWRAQRRWQSSPLWIACILFAVRVVADIARSFAKPLALVGGISLVTVIAIDRTYQDPTAIAAGEWTYAQGGFDVTFPATWTSAEAVEMASLGRFGEPLPGSTHRRRVAGGMRPRYVTAQAYEIGEMGWVRDVAASLLGPGIQTLWRPTIMAMGIRGVAYRVEDDGTTQAALVFRGRDLRGFAIGIRGSVEDEEIVLAEASRIADSIQLDGRVLTDTHIGMSRLFGFSRAALERIRYVTVNAGELRDSASVRIRSLSLPDATDEECRAAAAVLPAGDLRVADSGGTIFLSPPGAPRAVNMREFETRLLCANSSVTIRSNIPRGQTSVHQVDEHGTVLFSMIRRVFQPDPWIRVLVPPPSPPSTLLGG